MDKMDRNVIDSLSEPAKRMFLSLDKNSQKRMLKQAREFANMKVKKGKQKGKAIQKSIGKKETKKRDNRRKYNGSSYRGSSSNQIISNVTVGTKQAMLSAMHALLLGESVSDDSYRNGNSTVDMNGTADRKSVV